MQTLTINMNVPLKLSRDGELFIATCPLLDIVTQGDTEETAKKKFARSHRPLLYHLHRNGHI